MTDRKLRSALVGALASIAALAPSAAQARDCDEPLPLDPAKVTQQMGFRSFDGTSQAGPMCALRWKDGKGASVSLLVYGPKALAAIAGEARTTKDVAQKYAGESPKGAEPIAGVKNGFTVFDPKTRNRRVIVEHGGKPYLINVTGESIPLEKLAAALVP